MMDGNAPKQRALLTAEQFDEVSQKMSGAACQAAREVLVNGATIRGAARDHRISNTVVQMYVNRIMDRHEKRRRAAAQVLQQSTPDY